MKSTLNTMLAKFRGNDEGVTALEYALIAALIAVAIVTGAQAAGTSAGTTFTNVSNKIAGK